MHLPTLFAHLASVAVPLLLFAAVTTVALAQSQPTLTNRGVAPEWTNNAWLNSDQPLRLANLRGSAVLLEFWTFDCINCIRTIPYVQGWHETYAAQGLVTVGVHFPEFSYEHDLQNVRAATERLGITYPIALDNDGATWDAYGQRYWPTLYLIDKQGIVRYMTIGEGRYATTEAAIKILLAEPYTPPANPVTTELRYLTPDVVLNVRAGAGIDQALIGSVQPGMAFVIEGEQNSWYAIRYGDAIGWVSGAYVTVQQG
jgi:thiol-disulfide isomerase/thioredoxin